MTERQLPLARQLEIVFLELQGELSFMTSGVVFVHIRNNEVGKFGIKHDALESKDEKLDSLKTGLSEQHQLVFRKVAAQSLLHKKHWTHGEIQFEFVLKNNTLCTSVQFESNYNMANLLSNEHQRNRVPMHKFVK